MTERVPKSSSDRNALETYQNTLRRDLRLQWLMPLGLAAATIDLVNGFEQIVPNNTILGSVISGAVFVAGGIVAYHGFSHWEDIPADLKRLERQRQLAEFHTTSIRTLYLRDRAETPGITSVTVYKGNANEDSTNES
jgi:hypothetical protein